MDQLGDNNPVLYFPRHEHPLEYDLVIFKRIAFIYIVHLVLRKFRL